MAAPTKKFDLYEEDLDSLVIECAGVPHPHSVVGFGHGSRDCQARYAKMNPNWKGVWVEEIFEASNGFSDPTSILVKGVESQYAARQYDKTYKAIFSYLDLGIRPRPGDYIQLYPIDEPSALLQVQDTEVLPNDRIILQMGQRKQDERDAFNSRQSLGDAYNENLMYKEQADINLTPGSLTFGDITHGWCTGYSASFTIPATVNDPKNNSRVTLDLSIVPASLVFCAESTLYFTLAGFNIPNGWFPHYVIGDQVAGIDITPYVNYGSATALVVYCRLHGEWTAAHTACTGHPTGTVNGSVHMYHRSTI